MATDIDVCNRALLFLGIQRTISALDQDSAEAKACNTLYTFIRDWCLGITNWNFARRTSALTGYQQTTIPIVVPWAAATSLSPPWLYGYVLPTDCLQVRYITNSDVKTANTTFLGEPKRFVIADDIIATVQQRVLLTNETTAVCIYTAQIVNPTAWPWYFERFVVSTLAWHLSMALVENEKLTEYLDNIMMRYFDTAFQANIAEGLSFGDTTPEWIQAIGINYPYRRFDGKQTSQPPQQDKPK